MTTTDEARAEAERRYPKRPFVAESHVQNSFVAGADWQASRKVEVTEDMRARAILAAEAHYGSLDFPDETWTIEGIVDAALSAALEVES